MMRILISILGWVIFTLSLFSQPSWIDPQSRNLQYNADEYMVGFSSVYVQQGDDINQSVQNCRQYARIDLSESISLSVNISSTLSINSSSNNHEEQFDFNAITSSSLETLGMVTEDYFDEANQVAYAIAYLKKRDLVKAYYKKLSKELSKVKTIVNSDGFGSNEITYEQYMEGLYLLGQTAAYSDMLMNLDISNEQVLMLKEQSAYNVILHDKINTLKKQSSYDIDLAIRLMIDQLLLQFKPEDELFVSPITFKNKGITTEFSSYFDDSFRKHLIAKVKISTRPVEKRITGNYWLNGDQLQVTVNVHKYDGEDPYQLISGESLLLDRAVLDSMKINYDFKENNDQLDLIKMSKNTVNGGVFAMVSTNKGSDGLYFKEGELLKIYIQVSRPSYIRLVNVWSNGSQLSLMENYFIDDDKVNQLIEMPFEWNASCPCGLELIKLYAQSTAFQPIDIQSKDGLDYVSGSLNQTVEKSRAVNLNEENSKDFYHGEASLLLTTLQK